MAEPGITFASREQAIEKLVEIQQGDQPVEPLFRPNGQLTLAALMCLMLGWLVAIVASVIVASAVLMAGIVAVWIILAIIFAAADSGIIHIGAFIFILMLGVLAIGAGALLGGLAAGWSTGTAGRLGRNQSPSTSGLLAALAAGTGAAIAFLVVISPLVHALPLAEDYAIPIRFVFSSNWLGIIVLIALCGISVFVGFGSGLAVAEDARFCDSCNVLMKTRRLSKISMHAAGRVVTNMKEGDLAGAISELSLRSGKETRTTLHTCPCCQQGSLEARLKFAAQINNVGRSGNPGTMDINHIVGSWPLTPSEVQQVLAIARKPASTLTTNC